MKINIIPAGIYDANCYILLDETSGEAAVIDPGGDANILIDNIKSLKAKVKMILLTHGHADHTGAVSELRNEFKCNVYINEKDAEFIKKKVPIYGNENENGDKFLKEGDVLHFGNYEIKCIETPGHTPGGMCFLIGNVVFTGDTLFQRSIGRTDFQGGNFESIIKSIKNKLLTLPDDTVVYPGHGPKSSIAFERNNNPFL
ncbi:metallo-beta-lactamase family protein [Clostridium pasteurianum DSM 525 = ATCC 6013]|uniref:Beta-lactamase domain protein n=1 Tax=Clostridium pasteurianum DSM 525 = ATCC 6013 TaxID=1262449 RepID=A0A0H3J484_CLOPA|nr:MBL fold metallo-hydrolase [Clostridium pasteurianum]AJA48289.1 metallo-beta-lactamase family protein [Clostridium pasteurianum DSM 525 = ATCC 6013]AJA52277.1 metallo-beta-lactamase family protein [Clostridium pasteurianum DSM 525 = ATCC 6013]AOZ75541.1 MBL fold metallo-hydrolase [Clostridium pasteurianum DSM 525 = ATCC 6013]AOZ79336.1 MBL fold metallo-hydrolase [Clostridium pasteurianum]ELP60561.1 metallo-beta-lactamase family protein [Clostridium pasteurianum DSM 525 = ATCC 6013]